jgi:murein DD-endopeptidase MepM/ murein hydrolase activator NlpD
LVFFYLTQVFINMSKEKEILDILSLYESILTTKSINEVSNASSELFGGSNVSIPSDGAHGGQSGWQSNNAWDIKATIGTPVYAVIGGTVKTYTDYGPTPIKKDNKTLFGAGFTVDSDDSLPDVYYTHLKDVTIKQGDKIQCGQLLGYVMDFPGSDYDHLHIGVETGNIRQFLNDDGTLKCTKGQTISGTTVTGSGSSSEKAYNAATGASGTSGAETSAPKSVFDASGVAKDDFLVQMGKSIAGKFLKTESIDKHILSIYKEILTNNKNIISELELVQLNDTSYSNLKYDNDGTHLDSVNKPLLDDLNAASKAAGIVTTITTASTGHPSSTNTGRPSRHTKKTAVDIAVLNGVGSGGSTNSANGNSEFRSLGNKLRDALVSMGYSLNVETGKDKAVLWQTDTGGNHYNHLHVSNNSGESSGEPTTTDSDASQNAYTAAAGTVSTKPDSVFDAPGVAKDDFLIQMGKSIAGKFLKTEGKLHEQKSFGNDVSNRYGRIIIPKDTNSKIKSPISGVVFNKRYSSGCSNQITIKNEDNKKFYLQFCGVSTPLVRDGQTISRGDVIGRTDSDVDVTMFDSSWNTVPIGSDGISSSPSKKEKSFDDTEKKDKSRYRSSVFNSDRTPVDNITLMASSLPAKAIDKVFGDRYDKSGKMTQKRWGGVADERPVDPWVLDFIKDPLGRKRVTENIEKIKKLLK